MHWLRLGESVLREMKFRGDSPGGIETDVLNEFAVRCGKSIHSIRKIVDATAWVRGFYPNLLAKPPARFPLTQALQLRAIHRLDPHRARSIANEVFAGRFTGRELTHVLEKLKEGRYRPERDAVYKKNIRQAALLEAQVEMQLRPLLLDRVASSNWEVRKKHDILPRCDFLVLVDGEPSIVVEAKALRPTTSTERLLAILGACVLWQARGLNVWLFVPREASENVDKLQSMVLEAGIDPIRYFLVQDEHTVPWEAGAGVTPDDVRG